MAHFSQFDFIASLEKLARHSLLRFDQLVNSLLDRSSADELVDDDALLLTDPEGAVRRLVLHCWIPPTIEVNDVGSRGQVQPRSTRLEREHEKRHRLVFLEPLHQLLALLHWCLAGQDKSGPSKNVRQVGCERPSHLPELGEDQRLLL